MKDYSPRRPRRRAGCAGQGRRHQYAGRHSRPYKLREVEVGRQQAQRSSGRDNIAYDWLPELRYACSGLRVRLQQLVDGGSFVGNGERAQ